MITEQYYSTPSINVYNRQDIDEIEILRNEMITRMNQSFESVNNSSNHDNNVKLNVNMFYVSSDQSNIIFIISKSLHKLLEYYESSIHDNIIDNEIFNVEKKCYSIRSIIKSLYHQINYLEYIEYSDMECKDKKFIIEAIEYLSNHYIKKLKTTDMNNIKIFEKLLLLNETYRKLKQLNNNKFFNINNFSISHSY